MPPTSSPMLPGGPSNGYRKAGSYIVDPLGGSKAYLSYPMRHSPIISYPLWPSLILSFSVIACSVLACFLVSYAILPGHIQPKLLFCNIFRKPLISYLIAFYSIRPGPIQS